MGSGSLRFVQYPEHAKLAVIAHALRESSDDLCPGSNE